MLKLGVGERTTPLESGEGYGLVHAHPRLRAEAMKSAEGRALTRALGRLMAERSVVGAEILFHSDWSTALGTSDAALRDTDKSPLEWTAIKVPDGQDIVTAASTGLTWPAGMANVMEAWQLTPSTRVGVRNEDRFAAPAPGDRMLWRFYIAKTTPDAYAGDPQVHAIQDGRAGGGTSRNWALRLYVRGAGLWTPELYIPRDDAVLGGGAQISAWTLGDPDSLIDLSRNVVYGFEVGMHIIDADSFVPSISIYDVNWNPLYGNAEFFRKNDNGDTLADEPVFVGVDLDGMRSLQCGSNGWGSDGNWVDMIWGGVAIGKGASLGPYSGGV